jgi:hypothetical protein
MTLREDRQPKHVRSRFERQRRLRFIASSAAPATNNANVPGSGTGLMAETLGIAGAVRRSDVRRDVQL